MEEEEGIQSAEKAEDAEGENGHDVEDVFAGHGGDPRLLDLNR